MIRRAGSSLDCSDTDALHLERARWLVRRWRRVPFLLVLALGSWLAVYVALVGAGTRAAARRLPASRAACLALKPPAVPDEENAAIAWRRAFAALEGAPAHEDRDSNLVTTPMLYFVDPAIFAGDSAVMTTLRGREAAIDLAEKALRFGSCDWDSDYSDGLILLQHPFVGPIRHLRLDIGSRQILAAREGDWERVLELQRHVSRAARHVSVEPGELTGLVLPYLFYKYGLETIQRCILVAPELPPAAVIRALREAIEAESSRLPRATPVLEQQALLFTATTDRLAAPGGIDTYSRWLDRPLPFFITQATSPLPLIAGICGDLYREIIPGTVAALAAYEDGGARPPPDWRAIAPPTTIRTALGEPAILHLSSAYTTGQLLLVDSRALTRAALVVLAALEHCVTRDGAFPATLDDLGVPEELLVDPWSEEQERLFYHAGDDFVVVRSVGRGGPTRGRLVRPHLEGLVRADPTVWPSFWVATPAAFARLADIAEEPPR